MILKLACLSHSLIQLMSTLCMLLIDASHILRLALRSRTFLEAENLFLRKQLALWTAMLYRNAPPMAPALVWLARWFDWRQALCVVQPETLLRGHRAGFRLFWRWKSRRGRPQIPAEPQVLIHQMARDNPTWGQERIANELRLKLGLQVSPRTVRTYMPTYLGRGPGTRVPSQRWATFVRNHAQAIVACDFCVAITATFRLLYVFMVIDHASRRLLHVNVTAHPSAEWTLQQLRGAIPADHRYRFLIHDRDSIFSQALDRSIGHLGLHVLKTPVRTPVANAMCERVFGTLRREWLDCVIPFTDTHLRRLLNEWVHPYNEGHPHMALGPGFPQVPPHLPVVLYTHRHRLSAPLCVATRPVLGGLHHEYRLDAKVA